MVAFSRGNLTLSEWMETHLWLRTDDQQRMPLIANKGQQVLESALNETIAICESWGTPGRAWIYKPRREGYSSWLLGRLTGRSMTESNGSFRYINTTDPVTRKSFVRIVRNYYDEVSDPRVKPALRNPEAQSVLDFPELGTLFDTAYASTPGSCRGEGYQEVLLDEVAKIQDVLSLRDARRLVRGAILPSARFGNVWGLFTPDGEGDIAHEIAMESISLAEARAGKRSPNGFIRIFLPHWQSDNCRDFGLPDEVVHDVIATLTDEERHQLSMHSFRDMREQAERIHWRRNKRRELKELFFQEYPEDETTAWITSGVRFFDLASIQREEKRAREPLRTELGGALTIWEEPVEGRNYIVATDAGHGLGQDWSYSVVLCFETCEVVAELKTRDVRPTVFATLSVDLCRRYRRALWAPENRRGPGQSCTDWGRQHCGYRRVYRHRKRDRVGVRMDRVYGWDTNSKTRPVMLEMLQSGLEEGAIQVNSPELMKQLRAFQLSDKSGTAADRYEAKAGSNDDGVIALAIAWAVRAFGQIKPQVIRL